MLLLLPQGGGDKPPAGWSQSPIHRECFCYMAALFALPKSRSVAIPYSSGMLLLPDRENILTTKRAACVAIPYSSGMLLLLAYQCIIWT